MNSDISEDFLNLIRTNMQVLREAGAKCILRFAYTTNASDSNKSKWDAKPEIVFETPVSEVIEGNDGMGQLISHKAMNIAIEKAKTTGMAVVTVRNSNHFGIAGYYAKMACDAGLIGFSGTNSEAIMVPTFGRLAMIGSNPIAISMPADPYPFFFDASTTVVTRGKLEMYNKMEKPLPDGWALNKDGKASTDAPDVLANIVSDVIIALVNDAAKWVKPDGKFICSGIIENRWPEVKAALEANGIEVLSHKSEEEWHCFVCR